MSETMQIPPFAWDGAKVGKCYNNVQELIRRHGGEVVFGWALTDVGPHRNNGHVDPPPLYRRWANHAVWRDAAGKLWEVTPNAVIDKDRPEAGFVATEFLPDPEAEFEILSDENWVACHSRYVPLRPAGVAVTELLTQAQLSTGNTRTGLLNKTASLLQSMGYKPLEWRVETIGERTGSIWMIAE